LVDASRAIGQPENRAKGVHVRRKKRLLRLHTLMAINSV